MRPSLRWEKRPKKTNAFDFGASRKRTSARAVGAGWSVSRMRIRNPLYRFDLAEYVTYTYHSSLQGAPHRSRLSSKAHVGFETGAYAVGTLRIFLARIMSFVDETRERPLSRKDLSMSEATCRRELDLEIPADVVTKKMESVAKEFARVARVPGFRPGKAPVSLIRRRFADDIKGEVVQSLVPESVEKAVTEQKLTPVSQPQVEKLDFTEGQPLKFRAVFEVLPEFDLGNYKDLELEVPAMDVTEEDVTKTLEDMRERAAALAPVEGRAAENGDFVQLKLMGTPEGGGDPIQADSVLCHIGAEETMEPFNENLRGANTGDHKNFDVSYPADYPDAKLAGKTYHYAVEVLGIKNKKLPELNDEFAKDVSDVTTLDELKKKVREGLEHARDHRHKELLREKVIAALIKLQDFPVPDSLVQHQMDVRLERVVRSLAAQGVDPRAVNVDWVTLRSRQQERATDDVKAELIVDRIATAENIDVTDEEVNHELEHAASHSGESAAAIHARLTKQGTLDRMRAKLRSDKTLDWLAQNSRIRTVPATESK
jgi:trigger factor